MHSVMIVDDEPVSQNYIRGLLQWEEEGYKLYPPVYSGEEARKILQSGSVDIVLLDVFMPGEDGVALSRHIADHYPKTAMVAVSSHDDYDYVREIMKNGACDYILKHRLNRDTLANALKLVNSRGQKISGKDGINENRERVEAWLFGSGTCPFRPGSGRTAVSIAKVPMEHLPAESGMLSLPELFPFWKTRERARLRHFCASLIFL